MKHAYLIIAHNNTRILNILIETLDDLRNDIYLLIDKKSKIKDSDINLCKYSRLFKLERTIDIRWGDYSQIKAELYLMKEAHQRYDYSYYHLLSGNDLPIKNQDYIHSFFLAHKGYEFIGFAQGEKAESDCFNKVMRYHFFTKYYKGALLQKIFFFAIRLAVEKIINTLIKRKENIHFKKGCNWFSITNDCCHFILSKEKFIENRFKFTKCCDEIFLQSLIYNSSFYNKCFCTTIEFEGCMRKIDWNRGKPYVWTMNDKDELCQSNKLFARKFSEQDINIALFLKEQLTKKNQEQR